MAETCAPVECKEPAPSIYLRDGQIEKFAGDSFSDLQVGDTLDVSFKVKVVGMNIRDGEEGKTRTIELELMEKGKNTESKTDKMLKNIGKVIQF